MALASCDDGVVSVDAGATHDTPYVDTGAPCTVGVRSCSDDGLAVLRCDEGGTRTDEARCDTTRGELCADARCVSPCAWAAESNRSEGCEFYAVGTLNSVLGRVVEGASRDQFPFAVVLANPWPAAVEVTLDGGGLAAPLRERIAPRATRTFTLPWVPALAEGGSPEVMRSAHVRVGAVRVRTSLPVAAYQFNPLGYASTEGCDEARCRSYSNDASLLLPVAALRRRYTVVTRSTVRVLPRGETRWRCSPGFVAVVATRDDSTVRVRLTARTTAGDGIDEGSPGTTLTHTLQRGDVLQVLSAFSANCARPEPDTVRGDTFCAPVPEEDLTGSIIEASAPVAVFAGHDCGLVPHDRFACDHMEEQLLPDEALGLRYVVPRSAAMKGFPDVLRVVATRPDTRLTFEPARVRAPVTLARAGDHIDFEHREATAVTASAPVVVAQFLVGAGYDPSNDTNLDGDPDMVIVPPIEQARGDYRFVAAPSFPRSVAVAIAPETEPLMLDGAPLQAPPTTRVAGYAVRHLRVSPGAHSLATVRRGARVALIVSGTAPSTSYSYLAGVDLAPIAPPP